MLLLDSQAVLWALDDSPRLGRRARQLISTAAPVYVSAATVFELTIKSMLGKLVIPDDFTKRIGEFGFSLLSISAEHAEAVRQFPELTRHDPFDRLLVAQAHCTGFHLLTADRVLLGLSRDFIVDASA